MWLIFFIIVCFGLFFYFRRISYTYDFAKIIKSKPKRIIRVEHQSQLTQLMHSNEKICVAGGKFSHGGHTMLDDGIYLDMIGLDKIIGLDKDRMEVTVESGITWNKLQCYLDENNLSVGEMQSYRNFSVGGSISVNCHGRGLMYPTIAESIVKLKVMLTSGKIVECSPYHQKKLFQAVIGGYGLIGIIVEATLRIEKNNLLVRRVLFTSISEIVETIFWVIDQPDIDFYNCNIYPTRENQAVHQYFSSWKQQVIPRSGISSWKQQDSNTETIKDKVHISPSVNLQPERNKYWVEMTKEQLLRRLPIVKEMRAIIEPEQLGVKQMVTRNYEMSYDVRQVQPLVRFPTTSILQEYFIPICRLEHFLEQFWKIIHDHKVNLLNLSIRYVGKSHIPLLNYTQHKHTIALVLYINIWNNSIGISSTQQWTRKVIDLSLDHQGTYYLPYLPFATKRQFNQAYPQHKEFLHQKKKWDSEDRLQSIFSQQYLSK